MGEAEGIFGSNGTVSQAASYLFIKVKQLLHTYQIQLIPVRSIRSIGVVRSGLLPPPALSALALPPGSRPGTNVAFP